MNPVLANLAAIIQGQSSAFIPKAYQFGKIKAAKKYGITPRPWGDRDNANIALLLNRHADELSKSMARAELQINEGATLQHVLENFISRLGSWSWALFPAMAMGMTAYIDTARQEISGQIPPPPNQSGGSTALIPYNDIGVIWHTAGDGRVCKICDYLNGRWFDAHEAYSLAASVHPGCRCPQYFDIGTPDEALVGPIPHYKPGTAQDIYRDLNVHGLAQARINKTRRANTPRGKV